VTRPSMRAHTFVRSFLTRDSFHATSDPARLKIVECVVAFVMAWSPLRRANAGWFEVEHPGDYATLNSNQSRYGTKLPPTHRLVITDFEAGWTVTAYLAQALLWASAARWPWACQLF